MELCKHLNFNSSLRTSPALFFYQTSASNLEPLEPKKIKIQGVKSDSTQCYNADGSLKNYSPHDLGMGNPHELDYCFVPPLVKHVFCKFSLRITGSSLAPKICSSSKCELILGRLAKRYLQAGGFIELGKRYAMNLLIGRWLWSNHKPKIEISVCCDDASFHVSDSSLLNWNEKWSKEDTDTLDKLTLLIADGLAGNKYIELEVTAKIPCAFCQEIYPSQIFLNDSKKDKKNSDGDEKGSKKKTRQSRKYETEPLGDGRVTVCFTKDKTNAAIQWVDDWWEENATPIRVNEYGSDKHACLGRRHPLKKNDFYYIFKRAAIYERRLRAITPNNNHLIPNDVHFLMAILCKGGPFVKGRD